MQTARAIQQLIQEHELPAADPAYWNSIDPTQYLGQITAPIQIQVGSADISVPPQFSVSLEHSLQALNKTVDFHLYPDANHNLSPNTHTALNRTITFFNTYLK